MDLIILILAFIAVLSFAIASYMELSKLEYKNKRLKEEVEELNIDKKILLEMIKLGTDSLEGKNFADGL